MNDKKRQEEIDAAFIQSQKDERAERLAQAREFDWDTWEEETGLTRPEIPEE